MTGTKAEVQPKRIVALLDRNRNFNDLFPYFVYKIFVECDYVSGEHIKNIETIESGFFAMDAQLRIKDVLLMFPEAIMRLRKVAWLIDPFGITWQLVCH